MKRAYIELPEGQMHYRSAGTGEEYIILLHMSGSSSDEYEGVGGLLAERGYHVFAPDLLAFGSSDFPPRFYSMQDHIRTILAFMDAVGADTSYFYGNMATANMIGHIGAEHPDRVKGLMMGHPLYHPDPDYFRQRRHMPGFAKIDLQADGGHLMEMWRRAIKYGDPPEIADQRCCCLHRAGAWGETLHWALHEDTPLCEYLDKIGPRTVMIAYSFFGDPAMLRDAVKKMPNGSFDFFEGTPYIARADPKRVADMICKYFPVCTGGLDQRL